MPASLKGALVRETARRGSNVNDVATGLLAEEFGVSYEPTGRRRKVLAGSSPVILLRVPQELKDEIQAAAARTRSGANDVILAALADGLGVSATSSASKRKEVMASTNGSKSGARSKEKVRVALIGVGNCANSLLQGVEYYKDASSEDAVPGLMHVDLGGYHISDIEFVAAFDVVKGKVGLDLADAIWAKPNDTIKFSDVPKTGVKVSRGMTHDGIGKYMAEVVEKAPGQTDDVVGILKETGTDVVVNYLPVGSEAATKWYTEQILEAGVAMVNCMPVFIARENYWQKRFEDAGLPIIGDDIKSQVGATITHRVLTTLFQDRGVHLDRTMQLNVGGNSDFRNMLERDRLESKKISKTNAVTSMLDYDIGADNVHVGPSDFVPWLTDRKWAYIRMEGSSFGDVPLNVELKLEVWDSPNSAGIVIDAVRLAKLALNNGISGALEAPSAYLMKSPPNQIRDDEAHEQIERYIVKNAKTKQAKAATREASQDRGRGDPHRRGPGRFGDSRGVTIRRLGYPRRRAGARVAAVARGSYGTVRLSTIVCCSSRRSGFSYATSLPAFRATAWPRSRPGSHHRDLDRGGRLLAGGRGDDGSHCLGYLLLPVVQRLARRPQQRRFASSAHSTASSSRDAARRRDREPPRRASARPPASDSRAESSATKPVRRWLLSQNGFVRDCPQRQSTIASPSGSTNSFPPRR